MPGGGALLLPFARTLGARGRRARAGRARRVAARSEARGCPRFAGSGRAGLSRARGARAGARRIGHGGPYAFRTGALRPLGRPLRPAGEPPRPRGRGPQGARRLTPQSHTLCCITRATRASFFFIVEPPRRDGNRFTSTT